MKLPIKLSHILAVGTTVFIAAWMYNGTFEIGGQSNAASEVPPIADRVASDSEKLFRVSYIELQPEERNQSVLVRGRTMADAVVPVRAETAGIIEKRIVEKGDFVNEGDVVCVLDSGSRQASVASAEAQLAQAQGEYEANAVLAKKGFTAETKMRQMKWNMDSAKALLEQAQIELERTQVKANASGIVQDPVGEVGDVLQIGGTCVTLVDHDPMFFTGQLSERSVNDIKEGMEAQVDLVTGARTIGRVSYIAPSADPQTRTFQVEIELEDPGHAIRDGITANANIQLPPKQSFRVSPSWLTLADSGEVGLKTIGEGDVVEFLPVKILAQTKNGFWIEGPSAGVRIITLGQEYVISGEKVEPVPESPEAQG